MRLSGHRPNQDAKVLLGLPATHIQADFADHGLRDADVDAIDPCQVDPADAVEFATEIELRRMTASFSASLGA